jgi:hypothetical protein
MLRIVLTFSVNENDVLDYGQGHSFTFLFGEHDTWLGESCV